MHSGRPLCDRHSGLLQVDSLGLGRVQRDVRSRAADPHGGVQAADLAQAAAERVGGPVFRCQASRVPVLPAARLLPVAGLQLDEGEGKTYTPNHFL